jgi:hypothetical protein
VPHLRDSFIVANVGHFRGSENPDTLKLTHAVNLKPGSHEPGDDPFITFTQSTNRK